MQIVSGGRIFQFTPPLGSGLLHYHTAQWIKMMMIHVEREWTKKGAVMSRNGALYQWLADAWLFADTVLSITSRLMRRRTVMMHFLTAILIWRRDMAGSQGVINGTLVLGKFTTLTEGPTSCQSQLQWIFISIRQTGVVISRWGRCSKQWRWRYGFSKMVSQGEIWCLFGYLTQVIKVGRKSEKELNSNHAIPQVWAQ